MQIWILNHYAGTAESASTRHYDLSTELVKRGHNVTIFSSSFCHETFLEERLESNETWKIQNYDGVDYVWIKTFPYRGNGWRRIINMLSYSWKVVQVGNKLQDGPHAIIGSCVHPFAVLSAYILSRAKKSHFFFEVRDLWPQTLIDMGALSENSPFTLGLRALEKFLYQKAEKIITLLPYADQYICNLGIPREKIIWIPNGANLVRYKNIKRYEGGLSEPFTVMYLGAHGKVNALEVILDAAEVLQHQTRDNIKFVFVGNGPEKPRLIELSSKRCLKNVAFHAFVPKNKISSVMEGADAFIVSLEDLPVYKYGISLNKIFDYLASGRPIVFIGDAANNPVAEANAGICVPPRRPDLLAKALVQFVSLNPAEKIKMGESGLAYLRKYHDIAVLAGKLESVLQSVVSKSA